MKNNNQRGILLGLTLLGATTLIGLSTPASAKPDRNHDGIPNNARRSPYNDGIPNNAPVNRRNDGIPNNARRNPFNDGIPNNAPITRRNDGIPNNARRNPFNDGIPNNAPITRRNDGIPNNARRNPYNDGIPNNAPRNRYNDGIPNNAYRPGRIITRPSYGYGYNGYNRNNGSYNRRNIRGTVTSFRSRQDFSVRSGSTTYRVRATSSIPRALDRGDYVEVSGDVRGGNVINDASVSLLNNR